MSGVKFWKTAPPGELVLALQGREAFGPPLAEGERAALRERLRPDAVAGWRGLPELWFLESWLRTRAPDWGPERAMLRERVLRLEAGR